MVTPDTGQRARPAIQALALVGLGIVYATLGPGLTRMGAADVPPGAAEQVRLSPEAARALSFGHLPALVDWLLIRFLTEDPALARVPKGTHPPAYYSMDLASDLDPEFADLYYAAGNMLAVVRSDGEGARDILLKGTRFRREELPRRSAEFRERFWPQDWSMSMLLAYVYLLELGDLERGREALSEAAADPQSHAYVKSLAQKMRTAEGTREVGLRIIDLMLKRDVTEREREELLRKREGLGNEYWLAKVGEAFQRYWRAEGKSLGAERAWAEFRRLDRLPETDALGGRLSVDAAGKLHSSTPSMPGWALPR